MRVLCALVLLKNFLAALHRRTRRTVNRGSLHTRQSHGFIPSYLPGSSHHNGISYGKPGEREAITPSDADQLYLLAVRLDMKYVSILIAGVLAVVAVAATGQEASAPSTGNGSSTSPAVTTPAPTFQERNPRYRIRKGDTLDLDFALSPEFNQTVAVQPDGYATLKGVGTVYIQGQTIPELTETLKTAYAKVLHDPVIVIALKDFEKPYFIASGQVAKPGKYDLRSDLTITEALAIAGGFGDKAKTSQVVLYRQSPSGNFEGKVFNVKKLLASRNLSEDPQLLPGDLLYVPQNVSSRFRPYIPTASMGAYYNPAMY